VSSVHVLGLSKNFRVPVREAGVLAALKSLFFRKLREVRAVDNIAFELDPGEVVGFLGPNGAGKTTTLKMLSGLLYPTAGEARVLGYVPCCQHPVWCGRSGCDIIRGRLPDGVCPEGCPHQSARLWVRSE